MKVSARSIQKVIFGLFICLVLFLFVSKIALAQDHYDDRWANKNPAHYFELLKRAYSHYVRGVSHYKDKDLRKAEIAFKDALKVVPHFQEAMYLLADVYRLKGDDAAAVKWEAKAIQIKEPPVLEELEYLQKNVGRLGGSDRKTFNEKDKKIQSVLSSSLFKIIIALLVTLVLALLWETPYVMVEMFFKRRKLRKEEAKIAEEKKRFDDMFVEKFPGDDE